MARKSSLGKRIEELDDTGKESVQQMRDIFRHAGRALCFTIMAAQHPAGGPREDALIEAADNAWTALADKVIELALDDR